ncbi:hypothetical protein [Novosphingobium sp. TCA1]|uniref:hypothetical protein n=1 Tax=Novosphingobium sp. TCA1 TaxID=2682474 RepID=UPI001357D719|nr:hypothetical protein [Novosphingobium sp. TCA1]
MRFRDNRIVAKFARAVLRNRILENLKNEVQRRSQGRDRMIGIGIDHGNRRGEVRFRGKL